MNRPDFTRSGLNRSDRTGAALTVWNGRLASFNSRASTTVGDFTGRLDVFTPAAGDPRAWAVQSMAVPARVGGQQFGTAIEAGARGGHVTALVNVPFWNGPSSDNLGGDVLSWMASTMQVGGPIACIGLAASHVFNTTVMPFILRGVTLCGVDSVNCPMPQRTEVWRRLASDMKPRHLAAMTKTIEFGALPSAFDAFIQGAVRGRTVVRIA